MKIDKRLVLAIKLTFYYIFSWSLCFSIQENDGNRKPNHTVLNFLPLDCLEEILEKLSLQQKVCFLYGMLSCKEMHCFLESVLHHKIWSNITFDRRQIRLLLPIIERIKTLSSKDDLHVGISHFEIKYYIPLDVIRYIEKSKHTLNSLTIKDVEYFDKKFNDIVSQCINLERITFLKIIASDDFWKTLGQNLQSSIRKLEIICSSYSNCITDTLPKFEKLSELNLSGCKNIQSDSFEKIFRVIPISLEELKLMNTSYKGEGGEWLKKISGLKVFDLRMCKFGNTRSWDIFMESIPESIENLNLQATDYRGESSYVFKNLNHIKKLDLSKCRLLQSERWLKVMNHLPLCIEKLEISDSDYAGENVQALVKLNSLKSLNLSKSIFINQDTWMEFFKHLPESICNLNLRESNYQGRGVRYISHCKNLKKINFDHCKFEKQEYWNELYIILMKMENLYFSVSFSNFKGF